MARSKNAGRQAKRKKEVASVGDNEAGAPLVEADAIAASATVDSTSLTDSEEPVEEERGCTGEAAANANASPAWFPREPPFAGPPTNGRTVSIAVPASIVSNCQSFELRAYLAGQLARTCTVFGVDEIVVYEDVEKDAVRAGRESVDLSFLEHAGARETAPPGPSLSDESGNERETTASTPEGGAATAEPTFLLKKVKKLKKNLSGIENGANAGDETHAADILPTGAAPARGPTWSNSLEFLARNLAYLDTPQYLRKRLFSVHPQLRMAGLQNPLDGPHHLRASELLPYREGAVLAVTGASAVVDVGLPFRAVVSSDGLARGSRVTVRFRSMAAARTQHAAGGGRRKDVEAEVVSRREPASRFGCYWGYTVRAARNLREAVSPGAATGAARYDLIIGTSERGDPYLPALSLPQFTARPFRRCLILFGGLAGLEGVLGTAFSGYPAGTAPRAICHLYLNVCESQSSRTIRAEEAVLATLAVLRPALRPAGESAPATAAL